MYTTLIWLVLTDATAISALMAVAWLILVQSLLRVRLPRPRQWAIVALFVVVQWVYNFALVFYPGANPALFMMLSEIFTFTLQCGMIVGIIYGHMRKKFAQTLASAALGYFILHCFLVVLLMLMAPFKLWVSAQPANSLPLYLLLNLAADVPAYVVVLGYALFLRFFMRKTKFTLFFQSLFTSRFKATTTCVVCLLLMHTTRIVNLLFPQSAEHWSYYAALLLVDILLLFFFLFVAMFETNRQKLQAQRAFIVQQQGYVHTLEKLQQDFRAFRHDYQNMLSGLWLQAQEGDLAGVQQQVKSSMRYFDERLGSEIKQAGQVASIDILELKSLVMVKLIEMQGQGVEPRLEVLHAVQSAPMETEDLLRCLGILLDNAIEAAASQPAPWVSLALLQEGEDLLVAVANPVAEAPALHEMARRGYSTKGAGRGLGLASLREIVHHYPGATTKTVCEDGVFRQELHLRHQRRAAV